MPLVDILGRPGYRMPDNFDATRNTDPRLAALWLMADEITALVADAVNDVHGLDGEPALLQPSQVLVNFGSLSGAAINAPDGIQIQIHPTPGDLSLSPLDYKERRTRIQDYVQRGLARLILERAGDGYVFPEFDIEVIPLGMSGSSSTSAGVISHAWGRPRTMPDPSVKTS